MQIRIFLLATLLLVTYASNSDSSDTPNILIGTWIPINNQANNLSPCCQPTGVVNIMDNRNSTVSLTSTAWTGYECGTRDGSFQDLIYVNGACSFNELQDIYSNGSRLPSFFNSKDIEITIDMYFLDSGTTLNMVYDDDASDCFTTFIKSSQVVEMFTAVLAVCINLLFV